MQFLISFHISKSRFSNLLSAVLGLSCLGAVVLESRMPAIAQPTAPPPAPTSGVAELFRCEQVGDRFVTILVNADSSPDADAPTPDAAPVPSPDADTALVPDAAPDADAGAAPAPDADDSSPAPTIVADYTALATPADSCNLATERLNRILGANPDRLSEFLLRTGTVRARNAICAVRSENTGCNSLNLVLEVPAEQDPAAFLESLIAIDAEIYQLGDSNQHTRTRTYVRFGTAVQQQLTSGAPPANRPSPPAKPPIITWRFLRNV